MHKCKFCHVHLSIYVLSLFLLTSTWDGAPQTLCLSISTSTDKHKLKTQILHTQFYTNICSPSKAEKSNQKSIGNLFPLFLRHKSSDQMQASTLQGNTLPSSSTTRMVELHCLWRDPRVTHLDKDTYFLGCHI